MPETAVGRKLPTAYCFSTINMYSFERGDFMRFILVVFLFTIGLLATSLNIPESLTLLERCKDLEIRIQKLQAIHGIIGGRVVLVEKEEFSSVEEEFQQLQKRFFMLERPDHFVAPVMKEEKKRQKELEKILNRISQLLRQKYQDELLGDWNKWDKEKNKRRGKIPRRFK